jgi:hypothetical protein
MPPHHVRFYRPTRPTNGTAEGTPWASDTHRPAPVRGAGRYEIRLKGHLDTRWAAWFDGMTFTHDGDGTTRIHGPVVDQAALYGLLGRVRDLGLPLISVTQVEPDDT